MFSKLIFAAFLLSEGEGPQSSLLDVNPGLVIWTVIIFILLLWILKKTAWKPIISALDERERTIKESLEKAEEAQKEAERILAENKERLAKAEEEVQRIVEQGREYAEKLKEQILAESEEQARKKIEEAEQSIERKQQEAFAQLRSEIADIAVAASEKIIKETLDKEKQKKLVDAYLDELKNN
jgi:F-type H+-transporting ATPase subunit b